MDNLSPTNTRKLAQLEVGKARLLQQGLQRGFYGKLVFEVRIEDGTIQSICRKVEQNDK